MSLLRLIFMGTPELARVSLQALLASPACRVVAVVTQPDRPKGRALRLTPSPVKELAVQANLPVLQPERARDAHFLTDLRKFEPDIIAVAAYGQILPRAVLELPRYGCLNVHTSLLPRYRGAAPIQWAILNDDPETGVTIMQMDEGMDTGPILAQDRTPINPADNAQTLYDRLARMGAELLVQSIPALIDGKVVPRPQPTVGVVAAPKIKKQDGLIDWNQSARYVWNRVRGLVPWPGAFTHLPADPQPHLLKIWEAEPSERSGSPGEILEAAKSGVVVACAEGALRVLSLQRENSRRLSVAQFLAGNPLQPGQRLG